MSADISSEAVMGAVYKAAAVVGNTSIPFESYMASSWNHMTDNYSKFTIATLFSVILHEVLCSSNPCCAEKSELHKLW